MNFLAHIYLSGENDLLKIGNFMADGIRGNQFTHLPEEVQKGIVLHRAIDTFTDEHPIFRQGTKRLHHRYHHFSGVILDVFYDHFLARNWENYSEENLSSYTRRFYQSLHDHHSILTERTKMMLPYLTQQNWLESYQTVLGIHQILTRMDARTKNNSQMRFASEELIHFYTEYEAEFSEFFEEIQLHVQEKLILL